MTSNNDRRLGVDRSITRRDFVCGSTALLAGALSACRQPEKTADTGEESGEPDYGFDVGDDWYGPGGVGDYVSSHGNTPEILRLAHAVREGAFSFRPSASSAPSTDVAETGESYDLIVVGGGISGLAAAHHFRRLNPSGRCLVLDNHPIFGGEAKRNEFLVDGKRLVGPQGSNDFGILPETGGPEDYFNSLGIPRDFDYVEPTGEAAGMQVPLDHYSFLHWKANEFAVGHRFGEPLAFDPPPVVEYEWSKEHLLRSSTSSWVSDVWRAGLEQTPWNAELKERIEAWRSASAKEHAPRPSGQTGDEEGALGAWLDSMTVKEYYENVLGLPASVTAYVDPILASIIGLGCDAISAWWGWHFQLPGFRTDSRYTELTFHCFPGGNTGIARYFVKALVPEAIRGGKNLADVVWGDVDFDALDRPDAPVRLRMSSTVIDVAHEGTLGSAERVAVTFVKDGKVHRAHARFVVMASGGWMNQRVLRELPAAHATGYESFQHSAVLVANVALTNWRFLARLGMAACIWQGGFGFAANIRRPMKVGTGDEHARFDPEEPTVMTFYVPYYFPGLPSRNQGQAGRLELLQTSFATIERRIRAQMLHLFGDAGLDPANDIAGIVLNRWGHAYVNPGPGFQFGAGGRAPAHEVVREPIGRIAIGHSELRGHMNWTGAAAEGRRAVEALLRS
jgi:spermidine dehydrogenase